MKQVCVGFKAHLGWVNAAVVTMGRDEPVPILAQRIDLFEDADRETLEPYHVAGGWQGLKQGRRPKDPQGIIDRGRKKQDAAARAVLGIFRKELKSLGYDWQQAVVLIGRGIVHDLEDSLNSHSHIHVAEGEAIRDATRAALKSLRIPQENQDEKSTIELAAKRLSCEPDDVDEMMKPMRPAAAKSWSKEERLIALAAWLHSVN